MSARKKKEDEPVIEGAEGQYVIDEPDEVKHDGLVILRKVQRTKGHRKMYAITEDGLIEREDGTKEDETGHEH